MPQDLEGLTMACRLLLKVIEDEREVLIDCNTQPPGDLTTLTDVMAIERLAELDSVIALARRTLP